MFLSFLFKSKEAAEGGLRESIRNIFGFRPRNLALYQLAFRHKSSAHCTGNGFRHSNERLEYLGDAVLGSVVADFLFKKFPYKEEGFLTEMRSRIVSRNNLNLLSRKLGIDKLIQAGKENNVNGTSIMGDAFEAFVGALYLDKGYRFTYTIIVEKIIKTHLDIDALSTTETNFKSKIIEWAQKEKYPIEFVVADETETARKNKRYSVHLYIQGEVAGQGEDFSIKKAEQNAARQAWEKLLSDQNHP